MCFLHPLLLDSMVTPWSRTSLGSEESGCCELVLVVFFFWGGEEQSAATNSERGGYVGVALGREERGCFRAGPALSGCTNAFSLQAANVSPLNFAGLSVAISAPRKGF